MRIFRKYNNALEGSSSLELLNLKSKDNLISIVHRYDYSEFWSRRGVIKNVAKIRTVFLDCEARTSIVFCFFDGIENLIHL